jgi:hypothetical protein
MASRFEYEWSGAPGNVAVQRQIAGQIRRALDDVLSFAHDRAVLHAPRRTGNLQRAIRTTRITKTGNVWAGGLGIARSAPYGKWVETGTGIFGPRHSPIFAKRPGGVMRLRMTSSVTTSAGIRRQDTFIFRRMVKGQKGQHFIEHGYREAREFYMPMRMNELQRSIARTIQTARP